MFLESIGGKRATMTVIVPGKKRFFESSFLNLFRVNVKLCARAIVTHIGGPAGM
jgi:hypothetical protein